jgi:hypothetical protein
LLNDLQQHPPDLFTLVKHCYAHGAQNPGDGGAEKSAQRSEPSAESCANLNSRIVAAIENDGEKSCGDNGNQRNDQFENYRYRGDYGRQCTRPQPLGPPHRQR